VSLIGFVMQQGASDVVLLDDNFSTIIDVRSLPTIHFVFLFFDSMRLNLWGSSCLNRS
jgi:hypothetical protein